MALGVDVSPCSLALVSKAIINSGGVILKFFGLALFGDNGQEEETRPSVKFLIQ